MNIKLIESVAASLELYEATKAEQIAKGLPPHGVKYVAFANLKDVPTEANPSPVRMIAYTDWLDEKKARVDAEARAEKAEAERDVFGSAYTKATKSFLEVAAKRCICRTNGAGICGLRRGTRGTLWRRLCGRHRSTYAMPPYAITAVEEMSIATAVRSHTWIDCPTSPARRLLMGGAKL